VPGKLNINEKIDSQNILHGKAIGPMANHKGLTRSVTEIIIYKYYVRSACVIEAN